MSFGLKVSRNIHHHQVQMQMQSQAHQRKLYGCCFSSRDLVVVTSPVLPSMTSSQAILAPAPSITSISTLSLSASVPPTLPSLAYSKVSFSTLASKPMASSKPAGSGAGPVSPKLLQRQEYRKDYQRDGYLVVKNVLTPQEIQQLRDEALAILRGQYGDFDGLNIISVTPPTSSTTGAGDDAAATDTSVSASVSSALATSDETLYTRYARVDFPHKLSEKITELALKNPKIVDILKSIIGPDIKCMSSKLYIEGPGAQARLWHQDEVFIPTRDRSLVCAFVAIDPHTLATGCISAHPGSHREGVLYRPHAPTNVTQMQQQPAAPLNAEGVAITTASPTTESGLSSASSSLSSSPSSAITSPASASPATAPSASTPASSDTAANAALLEQQAQHLVTGSSSNGDLDALVDVDDSDLAFSECDSDDPDDIHIELPAGSVAFIHGYTVHRVQANATSIVTVPPSQQQGPLLTQTSLSEPALMTSPSQDTSFPLSASTTSSSSSPAATGAGEAAVPSQHPTPVPAMVPRMALKAFYSSAKTLLPWSPDASQPLVADMRDIVMVAGSDPYAYKGITNVLTPKAFPSTHVMASNKSTATTTTVTSTSSPSFSPASLSSSASALP